MKSRSRVCFARSPHPAYLAAACILSASIGGTNGYAAQTTTTFQVTATVLASCAVSATDLTFGNYTASSGTPTDNTSTVSVTCTNGLNYTIALDGGSTNNDVENRAMTDGSETLGYGLYTTGAYGTIWGDGTGATVTIGGTGDGTQQDHTVFGRIPIGQYVGAGAYSDTETVTVTY